MNGFLVPTSVIWVDCITGLRSVSVSGIFGYIHLPTNSSGETVSGSHTNLFWLLWRFVCKSEPAVLCNTLFSSIYVLHMHNIFLFYKVVTNFQGRHCIHSLKTGTPNFCLLNCIYPKM